MAAQIRSAEELVKRALLEPGLIDKIKADPTNELQKLAQQVVRDVPALQRDEWVYRIVVGALGLTLVLVVIGTILLTCQQIKEIPQVLTALGSAAVGALAGLLAPSPSGR